jgi:hypothetical protein
MHLLLCPRRLVLSSFSSPSFVLVFNSQRNAQVDDSLDYVFFICEGKQICSPSFSRLYVFREISFSLLHTPSDLPSREIYFFSKRIEELGFSTRDKININLRNRERIAGIS